MGFGEAIKSGFSKYFIFSGRAIRSEYWYWYLFSIILNAFSFNPYMELFISTLLFIPTISVQVRRFHDININGRIIGYLIFILSFVLLLSLFDKADLVSFKFANLHWVVEFDEKIFSGVVGKIFIVGSSLAIILMLILNCMEGTRGPNRFGDDPNAVSVQADA